MPRATVPFTLINLVVLLAGLARSADLQRGLSACWSPAIAAAFFAAPLLDKTAYSRLAGKYGLSPPAFHALNLAAHALPLVAAYRWRAHATARRASLALALHFLWGGVASRGTMRLDDVYVSLPAGSWGLLWYITLVCEAMPVWWPATLHR